MFSAYQRKIEIRGCTHRKNRLFHIAALTALVPLTVTCAAAHDLPEESAQSNEEKIRVLRVCAHPNNLPFSNQREEGFENRIASLLATSMQARLEYEWRPDRRGYIKRTLQVRLCDLVMAVPSIDERVLTTVPYYQSTYVFVTRPGQHPAIRSFDDEALRRMRIGLHVVGEDGFNPLPAHALARRGLHNNIVGYPLMRDWSVENSAGAIMQDVSSNKIDVAVVWGPFGGYFGKLQKPPLDVQPLELSPADLVYEGVYAIAMGVRKEDIALKQEIDEIIIHNLPAIQSILKEYGVPEGKKGAFKR